SGRLDQCRRVPLELRAPRLASHRRTRAPCTASAAFPGCGIVVDTLPSAAPYECLRKCGTLRSGGLSPCSGRRDVGWLRDGRLVRGGPWSKGPLGRMQEDGGEKRPQSAVDGALYYASK